MKNMVVLQKGKYRQNDNLYQCKEIWITIFFPLENHSARDAETQELTFAGILLVIQPVIFHTIWFTTVYEIRSVLHTMHVIKLRSYLYLANLFTPKYFLKYGRAQIAC